MDCWTTSKTEKRLKLTLISNVLACNGWAGRMEVEVFCQNIFWLAFTLSVFQKTFWDQSPTSIHTEKFQRRSWESVGRGEKQYHCLVSTPKLFYPPPWIQSPPNLHPISTQSPPNLHPQFLVLWDRWLVFFSQLLPHHQQWSFCWGRLEGHSKTVTGRAQRK